MVGADSPARIVSADVVRADNAGAPSDCIWLVLDIPDERNLFELPVYLPRSELEPRTMCLEFLNAAIAALAHGVGTDSLLNPILRRSVEEEIEASVGGVLLKIVPHEDWLERRSALPYAPYPAVIRLDHVTSHTTLLSVVSQYNDTPIESTPITLVTLQGP